MKRMFSEPRMRFLVWASLISQILIVVTGAAVRLTGSGLGCPTWPSCTEDSIVNVPEMGIHGVIEFGNRLLTFVLLLIAAVTLLFAFYLHANRKIRITSIGLVLGIFVQAVVGGISVLMQLNPWIVGLHFIISGVMIAIASVQLWRTYSPVISNFNRSEFVLSRSIATIGSIAVVIGVLVTGSGPHAGDAATPRNGLDTSLWQHYHSYPGYVTLALCLIQLVLVRRRDVDGYASRLTFWAVVCLIGQAVVGVAQSRLGLPVQLVIIHITLAAVFISLMSFQVLVYKGRKHA
jgi:cytochrome c oxidase assembly protein subunit 15